MSPTPLRAPARPEAPRDAVDGLLRELGARVERGSQALARSRAQRADRLASGIAEVDALLGGGLPHGRLSEITGPASSGRTSIAHALLARATGRGGVTAWVDAAGAFDAESAAAAGVTLARTLWVRPPGPREAARCCACLQDAGGFALVVLDLATGAAEDARALALPTATWQRLARQGAGTGTALLVLSSARATGSCAELVLELHPTRAHFSGAAPLLEGLSIRARVARQRTGPAQRVASVRLSADTRAA